MKGALGFVLTSYRPISVSVSFLIRIQGRCVPDSGRRYGFFGALFTLTLLGG